MDYQEEYEKIFQGGVFLRDGVETTIHKYRPFDGAGIRPLLGVLYKVIEPRESVTILDYGSGEAIHWHKSVVDKRTKTLQEVLGLKLQGFFRYDPCLSVFSRKPQGTFDIAMCTDVLEHIPVEDVPSFIRELDSYVNPGGEVLYTISTKPSRNCFYDGTNTHITMRSEDWWKQVIKENSKHTNHLVFDGIGDWYA